MRSQAWRAILWGGLIAGVLDLTAACVLTALRGRSPVRVFHSIASGLLGQDSFTGGAATAALGVLLHFFIALSAAAVYWVVSRKLTVMVTQPFVCGPLYGVIVYLVMNFIVLPLSAFPFPLSYPLSGLITGMVIIMVCVGLPIALAARQASGERNTA